VTENSSIEAVQQVRYFLIEDFKHSRLTKRSVLVYEKSADNGQGPGKKYCIRYEHRVTFILMYIV